MSGYQYNDASNPTVIKEIYEFESDEYVYLVNTSGTFELVKVGDIINNKTQYDNYTYAGNKLGSCAEPDGDKLLITINSTTYKIDSSGCIYKTVTYLKDGNEDYFNNKYLSNRDLEFYTTFRFRDSYRNIYLPRVVGEYQLLPTDKNYTGMVNNNSSTYLIEWAQVIFGGQQQGMSLKHVYSKDGDEITTQTGYFKIQ